MHKVAPYLLALLLIAAAACGSRPQNVKALKLRALANANAGDRKGAMEDLEAAVALDHDYVNYHSTRGRFNVQFKQYKTAIDDYETVLRLEPGNIDAYYHIAYCKYELGDFEGAIEYNTKALNLCRERPMPDPETGEIYFERGLAKSSLGDRIGACVDFIMSKRYGWPDYYRHAWEEHCFPSYGADLRRSVDFYDKLLSVEPSFDDGYFQRALYRSKTDDYSGALDDVTLLLERNPKFKPGYSPDENADIYYRYYNLLHFRGVLKHKLGDYGEAAADFRMSLQEDLSNFGSDKCEVYKDLAGTLVKLGRKEEGCASLATEQCSARELEDMCIPPNP